MPSALSPIQSVRPARAIPGSLLLTTVFPRRLHRTRDLVRAQKLTCSINKNKCIRKRIMAFVRSQASLTLASPSPNPPSNQPPGLTFCKASTYLRHYNKPKRNPTSPGPPWPRGSAPALGAGRYFPSAWKAFLPIPRGPLPHSLQPLRKPCLSRGLPWPPGILTALAPLPPAPAVFLYSTEGRDLFLFLMILTFLKSTS